MVLTTKNTLPAHILIIDDCQTNRAIIRAALQFPSFEVEEATNGQEGLARALKGDVDLAILDVLMPDLNGLEILRTLRRCYSASQLPIIMVTVKHESSDIVKALALGANDYVAKPIDIPVLLARIQSQLVRKRTEEALHEAHETLERRIEARTSELLQANAALRNEVAERTQAQEALFAEKERALVTLHSIGEAVVTTDTQGHIEQMNPVAEALTGWSQDKAHGCSIERVFCCVDEQTGERSPDPVQRCLAENRVIGPTNHTKLLHPSGQEYYIRQSASPIRNRESEVLGAILVFSDVSEARRLAQQMAHHASHDGLTGLVNRREFELRLGRVLDATLRHQDLDEDSVQRPEHALCYLDLDQFKLINDTCGHVAGDELLRQLSNVLRGPVRRRDTLARLGGDEFGVLMEHCSLEQARRVANALREAIEEFRFVWDDKSFNIGVSIGLVPINETSGSLNAVLSAADTACYAAKEAGRNRIHTYRVADDELAKRYGEMQWVSKINQALDQDQFGFRAQRIVSSYPRRGKGMQYELLLFMRSEQGQEVSPGAFLPAAERYGLTVKLDRWVVHTALRWLSNHPLHLERLYLCNLNLSGRAINDERFVDYLKQVLAASRVPPDKICFEISEAAAAAHLAAAVRFVSTFKSLGCRFVLDDFGSGLSSFAYLKALPVDFLKIQGSFVKDIAHDAVNLAVVKSINEIAHVMGIKTIAEHVDGESVLCLLQELGVDLVQGCGVDPPRPLATMLDVDPPES